MDEASSAGNPFDQVAACGVWPRRGGTLRLDISKKKRKESLPPQVYNEVIVLSGITFVALLTQYPFAAQRLKNQQGEYERRARGAGVQSCVRGEVDWEPVVKVFNERLLFGRPVPACAWAGLEAWNGENLPWRGGSPLSTQSPRIYFKPIHAHLFPSLLFLPSTEYQFRFYFPYPSPITA